MCIAIVHPRAHTMVIAISMHDHCPHAHYGKSLANITVTVASALPYSCVHVDSDHSRPCLTMHGVDSYHMHVATA